MGLLDVCADDIDLVVYWMLGLESHVCVPW